ncbi:MAG: D-alanine-D-alanine ligase [Gemmatimonadales bacterium]|jgi:D-alanine-D-alanine ligase|nr:D-alanine-D-alanine ligase [Gemmatimonadales bacterium]
MNITVLTYLDSEDENSKDYEAVVPQVARTLRSLGHRVSVLGAHGDVKRLIAGLSRRRPDLVFNLMEMFADNVFGDIPVTGLLDLIGVKYTGSGPGELYLSQDKGLTKKLLAFDGILYPRFAVFSKQQGSFETGGNLRMPLFVKPLRSDSSLGIGGKSLVHDAVALMERVTAIRKELNDSALAEEYIEGREFYVGVLGNGQPKALPPIEVDFTGFPEGVPKVLDSKAKWDEGSQEYKGTKSVLANLPDELRARLQKVAVDAFRALRVRDYGRVDLRLTDTGDIYVLEVNASCYLERSSEFAMSAAAAGLDYPRLIERIVNLTLERYGK